MSTPPVCRSFAPGIAFAAILLWTLALALSWSSQRLMWNDEFLSFYTDSLPTAQQVIHVQRYTPISLDPPTYHLLSHFSMKLLGPGPIALRLPALLGFLLLQVSLFFLLCRISTVRAALFGMALPVLSASFRYSVEGRPYAWMLGLYALALLCWLSAAESFRKPVSTIRLFSLLGLFVSIALAVTSHYFGFLILVPLLPAEVVRTVRRRTFDWPMWLTLTAATAVFALVLPFKQGLAPYRQHYYINSVSLHAISRGYRDLFLQDGRVSNTAQQGFALALAALLIWVTLRLFSRRKELATISPSRLGLATALVALAMLPVCGYLVGRFVTHTMEVRYVVASLIPFIFLLALALARPFKSTGMFATAMGVVIVGASIAGVLRIREEREHAATVRARMQPAHEVVAALQADPTQHLYVQNTGELFLDSYYAPAQLPANRLSVVYDKPTEISILGNDTDAVTAENASHFLPFTFIHYKDFKGQSSPLLVDREKSGMDWISKDIDHKHISQNGVGDALAGHVMRLHFGTGPTTIASN